MTPGLPKWDMEKRVYTPGGLRREKPSSVAMSKLGVELARSSCLKLLRGSVVGWWRLRSPNVRVGLGRQGKTRSGGTVLVLFEAPLVE